MTNTIECPAWATQINDHKASSDDFAQITWSAGAGETPRSVGLHLSLWHGTDLHDATDPQIEATMSSPESDWDFASPAELRSVAQQLLAAADKAEAILDGAK